MSKTSEAVRYALDTLHKTPKELLAIMQQAQGYTGPEDDKWLCNKVIEIAEADEVPYTQLIVQWSNIMDEIELEIMSNSKDKLSEGILQEIKEHIQSQRVISFGGLRELETEKETEEVSWFDGIDYHETNSFFAGEHLPEEFYEELTANNPVAFVGQVENGKANGVHAFVGAAGLVGVKGVTTGEAMLVRLGAMSEAFQHSGMTVVLESAENFWAGLNPTILRYWLTNFAQAEGYHVSSREFNPDAIVGNRRLITIWTSDTGNTPIQSVWAKRSTFTPERIVDAEKKNFSYSSVSMFDSLYGGNAVAGVEYFEDLPTVNPDGSLQEKPTVKVAEERYAFVSRGRVDSLPLTGEKFFTVTKENLEDSIVYAGLSMAVNPFWTAIDINVPIDGLLGYQTLVADCLPLFVFGDANFSKHYGILRNFEGEGVALRGGFDAAVLQEFTDRYETSMSHEAKDFWNNGKKLFKDKPATETNEEWLEKANPLEREFFEKSYNKLCVLLKSVSSGYIQSKS